MTVSNTTGHQEFAAAGEPDVPGRQDGEPRLGQRLGSSLDSSVTREKNLGFMAALISEITGLPEDVVVPEADLIDDLYIDSVAKIELMVACETRFGLRIPDDVVSGLRTVRAVLDYVESPLVESNQPESNRAQS